MLTRLLLCGALLVLAVFCSTAMGQSTSITPSSTSITPNTTMTASTTMLTDVNDTMMSTPTIGDAATPTPTTTATPTPTPTATPTEPTTPEPVNEAEAQQRINFATASASRIRADRFYCLGFKGSGEFNVSLSIAFQYPLLSYLDVTRKKALFTEVAGLLNLPDLNRLCIASYESYYVGSFDETVLVRLYYNTIPDPIDSTEFKNNYEALNADYMNSRAINITETYLSLVAAGDIVHPGPSRDTVTAENDPTFHAVVVGFGDGYVNSLSNLAVTYPRVRNPDPINYGIDGGDITFLVIGITLLIILLSVVVFGYCIHPFLM